MKLMPIRELAPALAVLLSVSAKTALLAKSDNLKNLRRLEWGIGFMRELWELGLR